MGQCYQSGDFRKYFEENMKALGIPVPSSLFATYEAASEKAILMATVLSTLGRGATMGELIVATTGLEKLAVVSALSASHVVGAVIGSIAVAIGRSTSCGARISDIFFLLSQNNIEFEDWRLFYRRHPEILDKQHPFRSHYGIRARHTPPGVGQVS